VFAYVKRSLDEKTKLQHGGKEETEECKIENKTYRGSTRIAADNECESMDAGFARSAFIRENPR